MKIINKLKFLFKKLIIKQYEYDELIRKSIYYDDMLKCVHINVESESIDIKHGKENITICKFTKAMDYMCSINIIKMLKAGGFIFDKAIKWNITIDDN